jgi:aminotransferase
MNYNLEKIQISGIRRFFNKVSLVPEAISLTLGQPDFPVPENIKNKMIEAIRSDKTTYTANMGIIELRKAISDYLKGVEINYSPDEICITIGGSEGLFSVFNSIINPGDKVVIPNPSYPAYSSIATLLGAKVIDCKLKDDFSLDIDALKVIIKEEKPKVLVLSFPSNPTGAVLDKNQKQELYDLLKDSDTLIVSDEIYCSIYFEDKYYSLAQYDDLREKLILIGGFSKMFSMTGLRIGYVCAGVRIMNEILKVHQYNVSCAPSIAQWGAYEGLISCMKNVEEMNMSFIARRDYVYDRLKTMGFNVILPKGAFYIFPSISSFNETSEIFCEKLLNEGKVAAVPGGAFGSYGDNNMRISYCYSQKQLEEALNRMEKWIFK